MLEYLRNLINKEADAKFNIINLTININSVDGDSLQDLVTFIRETAKASPTKINIILNTNQTNHNNKRHRILKAKQRN